MESDLTDAPFFASPVSAVPRQRCTRLGLSMHIEFVVVFRYGSVAPLCHMPAFFCWAPSPRFFLLFLWMFLVLVSCLSPCFFSPASRLTVPPVEAKALTNPAV